MNEGARSPGAIVTPDPWRELTAVTPARLALGRAGSGLPTSHVLALAMAHAQARDAVHAEFDATALDAPLAELRLEVLHLESAAPNRETYLRRPDFGRRLSARSRDLLKARPPGRPDISVVVADGLSATAVRDNALALLAALVPRLRQAGLSLAPVVLARQARVALGDEVGQWLGARFTVMLIGERPGLSAADSLGAYLTFAPRIGRTDAERNCVSNIRSGGLVPPRAAAKIGWLVDQAFALGLTGVALKDASDAALPPPTAALPATDRSIEGAGSGQSGAP